MKDFMSLGGFQINQMCYIALRDEKYPNIEGTIVGFAPARDSKPEFIAGSSMPLSHPTVDALVVLQTFSRGSIYQVPLNRLRVVDKWHDESEVEKLQRYLTRLCEQGVVPWSYKNQAIQFWTNVRNTISDIDTPDVAPNTEERLIMFWQKDNHYLCVEFRDGLNPDIFYRNKDTGKTCSVSNNFDELANYLRFFVTPKG